MIKIGKLRCQSTKNSQCLVGMLAHVVTPNLWGQLDALCGVGVLTFPLKDGRVGT
jgi:hypothetical protein